MRIQHAPQSRSPELVIAYRNSGDFWGSTTIAPEANIQMVAEDFRTAALFAEIHDEYYFSIDDEDVDKEEAWRRLRQYCLQTQNPTN